MIKKLFSKFLTGWKKIGLVIGNFISTIVMGVFYFTFFAIFAILFKIFSREPKDKKSNFIPKKSTISNLEEFKNEF